MKSQTPAVDTGHTGEANFDFSRLADLHLCPPPDATPVDGTFYAFHDFDPPSTEADFTTAAQRGQHQGSNECLRRSNSVWSDLAELRACVARLKKLYPRRPFHISEGRIRREHGVVKDADKPHCSFWASGTTSMHAIFNQRVA